MDGMQIGGLQVEKKPEQINTQKNQEKNKIPEGMYRQSRMEIGENGKWYEKNVDQRKAKLGYVRTAIEKEMSKLNKDPYLNIDKKRLTQDEEEKLSELHYARGTKLINEGHNVLELDLAGSNFKEFRAEQKGFHGKSQESEEAITAHYGASKSEKLKHVRTKEKLFGELNKTRVTIAGAQNIKGLMNVGDYSIENVREYALEASQSYLTNIFSKWHDKWGDDTPQEKDIHILLRGHSRGGIAAIESAMMIKKWVEIEYPEYMKFVKFELTQYDPVAGLWSNHGTHEEVDNLINMYNKAMSELGDSAETTVMYSIQSDKEFGFTPQVIRGAKRVILTPFRHNMGQNVTDSTQDKRHRTAYTDASTGEVYRGAAINELPEGVYYLDEQNTLVRMETYEQVCNIMNDLLRETKGQEERHQVILTSVRDWFEKRGLLNNFHENMDALINDKRKTWGISFSDSEEMGYIKGFTSGFKSFMGKKISNRRDTIMNDLNAGRGTLMSLKAATENYIREKNPYSDAGKRRLELVKSIRNHILFRQAFFNQNNEELFREISQLGEDAQMLTYEEFMNRKLGLNQPAQPLPAQPLTEPVTKEEEKGKLQVNEEELKGHEIKELDIMKEGNVYSNENLAKWFSAIVISDEESEVLNGYMSQECLNDPLFKHKPSIRDIKMGSIKDGKFLTALSALAIKNPDQIMNCMKDNGDGTVTVKFYKTRDDIIQSMPTELRLLMYDNAPELMVNKKKEGEMSPEQKLMFFMLTVKQPSLNKDSKHPEAEERARKVMPAGDNLANYEKIKELAAKLAEDTRMKPVIDVMISKAGNVNLMRAVRQKGEWTLRYVVREGMKALANIPDEDFNNLMKDYGQEFKEVNKTNKDPVYVTVTKSTYKNGAKDGAAQDALWVQIMEKAYAASGLAVSGSVDLHAEEYRYLDKEQQKLFQYLQFLMASKDNPDVAQHLTQVNMEKVLKTKGVSMDKYRDEAMKQMNQGYYALLHCNVDKVMKHITG